jgi:hypothetical protein
MRLKRRPRRLPSSSSSTFLIGLNMGHALSERAPSATAAPAVAAAATEPAELTDPQPESAPDPAMLPPPAALDVAKSAEVPRPHALRGRPAKAHAGKSAGGGAVRARPADSSSGFLEAVRLLRRAQRAVRTGDAAVGSSLLDQLDERFSSEVLQEERQATRVSCWCASGEVERAQALARELLEHNPRSIYARRIRQSCAASALEATLPTPVVPVRR